MSRTKNSIKNIIFAFGFQGISTLISLYMYDSFPVIIWSISLFCLFLCVKNENAIIQKVLSNLAGCLIPIYAIHNQILRELKTVEMLKSSSMELLCYLAVIAICVIIGLILSRIPVLNRLTKI